MLSAVAARKARLAQSQTLNSPPDVPKISPASASPSLVQKPSSKRKSTVPAANAVRKKSRQHPKIPFADPARYYAQGDVFKIQDNAISFAESDGDSSEASLSTRSQDGSFDAPARTGRTRRTRVWSPSAPLPDSSDEENGDTYEHIILDVAVPPTINSMPAGVPSIMSTFQPVFNCNVFPLSLSEVTLGEPARRSTALLLKSSETLALVGTYAICVLYGSVTLAGATLTPATTMHPVFAPRSSPIHVIQSLVTHASTSDPPVPVRLPSHVLDAAKGYDVMLVLQELHTGVEGLGKVCRAYDGFFAPSRWERARMRYDLALDNVYFLTHETPDIHPMVVPASWNAALQHASPGIINTTQRHVHLVKGPKNAGKSTFARLLLNSLLSRFRRVAYLECDLGQSEFTPGGMVSLNVVEQHVFGPPFSHPTIPYAAHYIGATTPRTSPSHYLDSIQALNQLYDSEIYHAVLNEEDDVSDSGDTRTSSETPLVVNTMGWTKGSGADFAEKVEDIIRPSHVYSFEHPDNGSPRPTCAASGLGNLQVHVLDGISSFASHYTAADHRNLAMLSYFHVDLPKTSRYASPSASTWQTALPLCAQPPYEVDCGEAFEKLIITGAGMEDVVHSEVHRALNGAIVALVSCDPGTMDSTATGIRVTAASQLPYEQGASPPSPYTSRCIGLALVRAIAPSSSGPGWRIQLLTPVPPHLLGSVRVLVMGEMQLPIWGMLDYRTLDEDGDVAGYDCGKVPYLRWGKGEGAGGERRRVRRNLMRRGQM